MGKTGTSGPRFQLILIKPSHYDNDGYVVQWLRSTMPSNSLAAVYSLALGAAERQLLGPDLPIDVMAMDETNTRVRPREIARRIAENGGRRARRHRRRAIERVPPRRRYRAAFACGRRASHDRRLPRLGLPLHAEGAPERHQGSASARRVDLRRRGRGRPRRGDPRRRARGTATPLRSHEASAGYRRHRRPALPARRLSSGAPSAM